MANQSALSLYADTPEGERAVQEYRDQQKMLMDSLVNRKQLFDPTLLAISQALGAPTRTGSFGEVIGNVAGAIGPVQQAEEKRSQDIAKMRFDMAQQNLQSYQATAADKTFNEMNSRSRPPVAPPTSGSPPIAGAPSSALPAAASAAAPSQGQFIPITSDDIARLANMRGGGAEKAKILRDKITLDRDRYVQSMNGIVFDKDTQTYLNLEIPGQKQEPFTTNYGRFDMTPYEYSQYKQAEAAGQGRQFMDAFTKAAPATPGAPAGPNAAPSGRPTVADAAAQAEAAKTKAVDTTKAEVGRTQEQINMGQDATGRMASYSALRSIASRPDAKEIFGIFNRPEFGTQLLKLVQEGVQSPGTTTIRAGGLEDAYRNVNLTQDQINRYGFGLSIMANIQLQQAKLAAGQGAISNFERDLFASATLSPKDNPGTILAKLSMMEARTDFERQRAAALRKSKMDADDFAFTPESQRISENYLQKISGIASNFGGRPAQRPPAGNFGPAREQLYKRLGLPS